MAARITAGLILQDADWQEGARSESDKALRSLGILGHPKHEFFAHQHERPLTKAAIVRVVQSMQA
eukprot:3157298-Amphidinium_carterae.1